MRAAVIVATTVALAGCGGGGDRARDRGPERTVHAYFAAVARGDGPGACAQLTPASRAAIGEAAGAALHRRVRCPGAVRALLRTRGGPRLRGLVHARVRSTKVAGDRATVVVVGAAPLRLVREPAGWRIDFRPAVKKD